MNEVIPINTVGVSSEELKELFEQYPELEEYLTPEWKVCRNRNSSYYYLYDGETEIGIGLYIAISKMSKQKEYKHKLSES